ncbi:tyrosine-type recombinase/integrase [Dysosmobacter welbionis]|jgi:integrase
MASIRKRGSSYLLVVSMGYDYKGNRIKPKQKTVHPPERLTPKQKEKWLNEQAVLFERECKGLPQEVDRSITLAKYTELWFQTIAPGKLAKSTLARERQDIDRFLPVLGNLKLTELRPEHFRQLYANLRKVKNQKTGKPLSECTVEGVHACLCGILSDAMEGGFLDHNPAWRTYRYAGKKKEKAIADEATTQRLITALEEESLKYETYFKLIIATGMRRGECCGLQWGDINWQERSIHIQRNVVKVTGEDIIVKETKTVAGDRYVYFSLEMESLLKEFQRECAWEAETYDNRKLEDTDYIFRRHGCRLPMTPTTFTWRFKLILKKHGLPAALNVHSLRHTNASLLIAGGADVATVAGLLGHSQPSTTLDIYTHAFDKNKKAASRVLQEGLEI